MSARGFSLLEVLVAMAILVVALAALLGHQGVGIQMADFSNRVSQRGFVALPGIAKTNGSADPPRRLYPDPSCFVA